MGGFNHLADSAPHAHPGQGENDHIDDQEDNRINDDQEVTRTDEPDSMVLSETETEDEDENDSPFIVRHQPRVATNADSGESGESGESQETKADERNHQSHIGRRIQKQFEHHSGNWLYEGEITEVDESKDEPIFRVEFSNGLTESMTLSDIDQNLVTDTSTFDERNIDTDINTDNILPEGSRRSTRANASKVFRDKRTVLGAKKLTYKNGILIPRTHAQAMRTPQHLDWAAAEQKEIDAMKKYEVFEEVDYLPNGVKPLHFMVLYTIKDDGRFKVRMVARGDRQTEDTYDVTCSPVVRSVTLRFLIALAATYDFAIYQTDVNTAYLNADIDFDIYFIAPDCFPRPGTYLRARKAIYGLKQAGVCWYKELEDKLIEIGFQRTIFDYCVWGS
ncbi:MAG: reverse transcriptase domain-containing protein, partial [Bacteroidota bacterium]